MIYATVFGFVSLCAYITVAETMKNKLPILYKSKWLIQFLTSHTSKNSTINFLLSFTSLLIFIEMDQRIHLFLYDKEVF